MRLLILFLLFGLAQSSAAQIGTGQWRLHIPSKKAIDVVALENRVYTAYVNGVSEYDYSSGEISLWDAVNSMSDITLSCLGKHTGSRSLFVGYENGNIDKIKGNRVTNIPAVKLAQVQGSKRINRLVEFGKSIYAATGFAIVKIDPIKNEVQDTYYPTNGDYPILDIAFLNDSIYAITSDRLYRGLINNIALADPVQWDIDTRVPIVTGSKYADIEAVNNELYLTKINGAYGLDSVFRITHSGIEDAVNEPFSLEVNSLNSIDNLLAVNLFDGVKLYNNGVEAGLISSYVYGVNVNPKAVTKANGSHWVADGLNGLMRFGNGTSYEQIAFSGPPKNDFYALDWNKGKLAVASGGLSGVAGMINRSGVYLFEDESWSLKDGQNMTMWKYKDVYDFLAVSINPTNENQVAVGTYSNIPLSLLDANGQVTDTLTPYNSPLEWTSIMNGASEITDLKYDESGNLWILNGYANKPLKVYTSGGDWYQFDMGAASKNKHGFKMAIDYNGNKWIALRDAGMFGYNDNGTISTPSDDKHIRLTTGTNSGALPSNQVNTIAVDFDNEIWIGTDAGFAILYNSESAFDGGAGNFDAQRIKLEFEGNVEYVLGATDIKSIVVDGANRKWFGTANAGIILLSPDGLEILEQHTTENSPLISNSIIDLELNQNTGELFIVTDKGLVSYRTDATYEDPEYENVKVFPNPVRPDYSGPITIQGIRYDSDVRITDIAGNLVYETTSNGGTATWNGKTIMGDDVGTGVYLIWTAANEGKGKKVGKVLVVKE